MGMDGVSVIRGIDVGGNGSNVLARATVERGVITLCGIEVCRRKAHRAKAHKTQIRKIESEETLV